MESLLREKKERETFMCFIFMFESNAIHKIKFMFPLEPIYIYLSYLIFKVNKNNVTNLYHYIICFELFRVVMWLK